MLVTSRSYVEYRAMFDLDRLPSSVLDCCAGGSGFTAVAAAEGADAVAVDPAYGLPDAELEAAVRDGASTGGDIVDRYARDFVWHWYGSRENRDRMRAEAAEVRVFPLVVQGDGAPVPFLDQVRRDLAADGVPSRVRKVPYEFQRGADEMLVCWRLSAGSGRTPATARRRAGRTASWPAGTARRPRR